MARRAMAAYNRSDFDAAVELFDPEIEWVLPSTMEAESCRGPEEIKRLWRGVEETFDEFRVEPQEFRDRGDRVAVRARFRGRGKASGVELDEEMFHHVISFREGMIVRIEHVTDWAEALEAAGLPPQAGK